jgi:hypothetical protein
MEWFWAGSGCRVAAGATKVSSKPMNSIIVAQHREAAEAALGSSLGSAGAAVIVGGLFAFFVVVLGALGGAGAGSVSVCRVVFFVTVGVGAGLRN